MAQRTATYDALDTSSEPLTHLPMRHRHNTSPAVLGMI